MNDKPTYQVIVTHKGQQIAVLASTNVRVHSVVLSDDKVKEDITLDVSPTQFDYIRKRAMTNEIASAILNSKRAR